MVAVEVAGARNREHIELTRLKEVEAALRFAGKIAKSVAKRPEVQMAFAVGTDSLVSAANKCPMTPQGLAVRVALGLTWLGISAVRR